MLNFFKDLWRSLWGPDFYEIIPGVFITDQIVSLPKGTKAVINCGNGPLFRPEAEVGVHCFQSGLAHDEKPGVTWLHTQVSLLDFVIGRDRKNVVLLYCGEGMSRSAMSLVAYMMFTNVLGNVTLVEFIRKTCGQVMFEKHHLEALQAYAKWLGYFGPDDGRECGDYFHSLFGV
jgi:protein-tyrosine phosphatase